MVTPSAWNGGLFFGWSECRTSLLGCLENRHLTQSLWQVNCPQSKWKGSSAFLSACRCSDSSSQTRPPVWEAAASAWGWRCRSGGGRRVLHLPRSSELNLSVDCVGVIEARAPKRNNFTGRGQRLSGRHPKASPLFPSLTKMGDFVQVTSSLSLNFLIYKLKESRLCPLSSIKKTFYQPSLELILPSSILEDEKTCSWGFHKSQTTLSVRQKVEEYQKILTEMIKGLIMRLMSLWEIMKIAGIFFFKLVNSGLKIELEMLFK